MVPKALAASAPFSTASDDSPFPRGRWPAASATDKLAPFPGSASVLKISCLHTSASNIAVFEAARRALGDDEVILKHRVRTDLLAAAEAGNGPDGRVLELTAAELRSLAVGAKGVLLTCSTLGPAVARFGPAPSLPVLRVDAALAEAAVAGGGSVVVLCAAGATIGPTRAVFEQAAGATGAAIEVRLVPDAWTAFKAGDEQRYLRLVAEAAELAAAEGGIVALAQASMAGAARLVRDATPPLTSPLVGLAAIVAAARAA
jgi:hypothetical protein